MKYRVDWFVGKQHNKTHFPTYEDAHTYAKGMVACTGVKSVFILEMTANWGVYDVIEQTFAYEKTAEDRGIFVRKCSICGSPVIAGYCVNDGMDYYCSDDCLHMVFTDEEWELVYQTDGGYYTE